MTAPMALLDGSPARRGSCPTLETPMQTGDGLLARIRVEGGVLTPAQLSAVAGLAATHGNGLVEVTARGNLQVRGLTPTSSPLFASAVTALFNVEKGLVVDTSPIAGLDPTEHADPRPIAAAIRSGAASLSGRLGPKVSVVVDGLGQVRLAAIKADIRLSARGGARWAVTLGGGKAQDMDANGAIAAALAVLNALAAMGPEARATDLFPRTALGSSPTPAQSIPADPSGRLEIAQGFTLPIALPFGSAYATGLIALAEAARASGVTTIRLAPGHALFFDNAPDALLARARELGFIVAPEDARRRVSACIGNQGCASGHLAARLLAGRLAEGVPSGHHLHVSGCAKGCAHPRRAEVTLVGRPDGIGLVINGRAGDTPEQILDEARLVDALVPYQVADDAV